MRLNKGGFEMDNRTPVKEHIKKTKKYVLIGFVLVLILTAIFYKVGYLPIVGELIANKKIELYKSEIYESNDIENTKYNLKSGMYETIDNKNKEYPISYSLIHNGIWDTHQIDIWQNQLLLDFEKVKSQMPKYVALNPPSIVGFVNANDHSIKIQMLYLSIYNEEQLTVEESEKKAAEFTMYTIDSLGKPYTITGVQIWYYDRNGGYTIEKLRNTNPLNYDFLLKNTRKIDKLGENELKWISELQ